MVAMIMSGGPGGMPQPPKPPPEAPPLTPGEVPPAPPVETPPDEEPIGVPRDPPPELPPNVPPESPPASPFDLPPDQPPREPSEHGRQSWEAMVADGLDAMSGTADRGKPRPAGLATPPYEGGISVTR
jgi:hypothetical protein